MEQAESKNGTGDPAMPRRPPDWCKSCPIRPTALSAGAMVQNVAKPHQANSSKGEQCNMLKRWIQSFCAHKGENGGFPFPAERPADGRDVR